MQRQRQTLPNRRLAETFELKHGGQNTTFQVTTGFFALADDQVKRTVAEVFISGAKAGSEVEAVARDGAVLLSLALQYGVPLEIMRHAITRDSNGAASSIVGAVIDKLARETLS